MYILYYCVATFVLAWWLLKAWHLLYQAIAWTNTDLSTTGPLGANLSAILIKI